MDRTWLARVLPSRSESVKYFHFAFVSILATIAWSEAVLWWNNKRLARIATRAGKYQHGDVSIVVSTNDDSLDVEEIVKSALSETIPDPHVVRVQASPASPEETKTADTDYGARVWAAKNLEFASDRPIKLGIAIEVLESDGLKQAAIVIIDGNDTTRIGRCNSIALPSAHFSSRDVVSAFERAWRQLL